MTTSTARTGDISFEIDEGQASTVLDILGVDDATRAVLVADAVAADEAAERERLVDLLLDAAYPANDADPTPRPWHEFPHAHMRTLADSEENTGKPSVVGQLLTARRAMAARILDALSPELAPAPDDDPEVPGQQPVATDTLRRWAVWCDQIAEHADNRRRIATNGARHLADHIRIEIAHPLNRPDLDPANYRDPSIFDADRQDPATVEDPA